MKSLTIERCPPLRLVKLDAGARNALTLEAIGELREAIAEDPEAPVVVLAGRRGGFCAGLDNATLVKGRVEREEILAAMGELLLAALAGPTRIVAACDATIRGGARCPLMAMRPDDGR